jgi:hypothetical protein
MPAWSTGRGEPRVVYHDGRPVAVAFTIEDAARIVRAMNEREAAARPVVDEPTIELPR